MRVIAGSAKGTRLASPRGQTLRPTLDRVRESLFNILASRLHLPDVRFLDLFAGTGANGIEALSRGVQFCDFVDNNAAAIGLVRKNLAATHLESRARVWRETLPQGLQRLAGPSLPYQVIFADPPYKYGDFEALFEQIHACGLLDDTALLVLEHPKATPIPEPPSPYTLLREETYGRAALSFYTPEP